VVLTQLDEVLSSIDTTTNCEGGLTGQGESPVENQPYDDDYVVPIPAAGVVDLLGAAMDEGLRVCLRAEKLQFAVLRNSRVGSLLSMRSFQSSRICPLTVAQSP
jgi:hypothetical protein